jgi:hypothetical protein
VVKATMDQIHAVRSYAWFSVQLRPLHCMLSLQQLSQRDADVDSNLLGNVLVDRLRSFFRGRGELLLSFVTCPVPQNSRSAHID